ncbi:MAG TPA: LytTR family DNA-binding domain-containing protein [Oleiagrimonas sp.]|nr:LytTR family DNA-binding domain-containing protein [Oleiagrimonas sp.]
MRILIVDDEPLARARLSTLLGQCPEVGAIEAVATGEAALARCAKTHPDLLLADINMPGMDGTALTRRLGDQPLRPQVIFCTAYEHFAAQAFELGAADYLLKPVRLARLREALERARRLRAPQHPDAAVPTLSVRMGGSEHRVALDEVFYLLAGDKYVTVHHAGGEDLTDISLRQLEQQYPDQLVRLHRSCLIPRQRLLGLAANGEGGTLACLAGTDATPHVSRRNLPAVRKVLHGRDRMRSSP